VEQSFVRMTLVDFTAVLTATAALPTVEVGADA
jgi:hypothetical protein